MNRLKCLFFVAIFFCHVGYAKEITINSDYKVPQGRGLVAFTLNAPSEFGFEQLNAFNLFWHPRSNHKNERSVGVGKKYPADLREKYKLNYSGRLIFLELEPGEYLFDSVGLDTPSNSLSIFSLADRRSYKNNSSRFTVTEQKVSYLGHIEILPFQSVSTSGSVVASYLFAGKNLTDFSAQMMVREASIDFETILKTLAPQLIPITEKNLVRSVLFSNAPQPDNLYPASGYAKVEDANALPTNLNQRCKDLYAKYIDEKRIKAFAIAANGNCMFTSTLSTNIEGESPIPAVRAITLCNKRNAPCFLYAVDNRVTYKP